MRSPTPRPLPSARLGVGTGGALRVCAMRALAGSAPAGLPGLLQETQTGGISDCCGVLARNAIVLLCAFNYCIHICDSIVGDDCC